MISLNSCPFGRRLYVKEDIYVGVKWYWYLFVGAVGDCLSYYMLYTRLSTLRIGSNWDIVTERLLTPTKRTQVFSRAACIFHMCFSCCLHFVWDTTKTTVLQILCYAEHNEVNLKYNTFHSNLLVIAWLTFRGRASASATRVIGRKKCENIVLFLSLDLFHIEKCFK